MNKIMLVLSIGLTMSMGCGKKDADKGGEGKKSGSSVVGSCDKRPEPTNDFQMCNEFTGTAWTADDAKDQCNGKNVFSAKACPTEGLVFSCKVGVGSSRESINRYYDQADKAKKMCEMVKGQAL